MSRKWKPGDVAATDYRGVTSRAMVVEGRSCPQMHPPRPHWHSLRGGWNPLDDEHVTHRPLVVIDPEDRGQVEELIRLFWANGNDDCDDIRATQAALREFANPTPPKPDEPLGLGAVVEDAEDRRWVRNESRDDCPWRCAVDLCWLPYSEITAVRILSPGVPS